MLHHPDFASTDLSSVRAVVIGGGPATPALVAEIRERLGAPVAVRYSCTEAGTGLGTELHRSTRGRGGVGRAGRTTASSSRSAIPTRASRWPTARSARSACGRPP